MSGGRLWLVCLVSLGFASLSAISSRKAKETADNLASCRERTSHSRRLSFSRCFSSLLSCLIGLVLAVRPAPAYAIPQLPAWALELAGEAVSGMVSELVDAAIDDISSCASANAYAEHVRNSARYKRAWGPNTSGYNSLVETLPQADFLRVTQGNRIMRYGDDGNYYHDDVRSVEGMRSALQWLGLYQKKTSGSGGGGSKFSDSNNDGGAGSGTGGGGTEEMQLTPDGSYKITIHSVASTLLIATIDASLLCQ